MYSHATIPAALKAGILSGHYQMEGLLQLESLVQVLLGTVKIVIRACTDPVGDPLLETETNNMLWEICFFNNCVHIDCFLVSSRMILTSAIKISIMIGYT